MPSLPLKWPQFQDALLWALGQEALCILIPFIFNQDQNIRPNLLQAAFGYTTSILLCFNWFGSSPCCWRCTLTVNIPKVASENGCASHLNAFSLYFRPLFVLLRTHTFAHCSTRQWLKCNCVHSASFTWLFHFDMPNSSPPAVEGYLHMTAGEKGHESRGGGGGVFFCGIMSLTMKVTLRPPWTLLCD